jgi:hypothetical protein
MKALCKLGVFLVLWAASAVFANASPILWNLSTLNYNPSTFDPTFGSGTVSGSFVFDADTNTLSLWSISTAGFAPETNITFTPANSTASSGLGGSCGSLACTFLLSDTIFHDFLNLMFDSPMTNAGGTIGISSQAFQFLKLDVPTVTTYYLASPGSVTSTPEAAPSMLVFVGALALLGFRRIRGRIHRAQKSDVLTCTPKQ